MPAHLKITDANLPPIRPALLTAGSGRVDACPKCKSKIGLMDQEPCFSRCRMCGTLTPVAGTVIANQIAFERSSGLAEHKVDWSEGRPLFHRQRKHTNGNGASA